MGSYKITKLPIDFPHKKPVSFIIMTLTINLSSQELRLAAAIKGRIQRLENQFHKLLGSSEPISQSVPKKWKRLSLKPVKKARRKMSLKARAKIAAAAKARWKKAKAQGKKTL